VGVDWISGEQESLGEVDLLADRTPTERALCHESKSMLSLAMVQTVLPLLRDWLSKVSEAAKTQKYGLDQQCVPSALIYYTHKHGLAASEPHLKADFEGLVAEMVRGLHAYMQ